MLYESHYMSKILLNFKETTDLDSSYVLKTQPFLGLLKNRLRFPEAPL